MSLLNRLVANNPDAAAVVWDSPGDRDVLEEQVLCPSDMTLNSCHTFKSITLIGFFTC